LRAFAPAALRGDRDAAAADLVGFRAGVRVAVARFFALAEAAGRLLLGRFPAVCRVAVRFAGRFRPAAAFRVVEVAFFRFGALRLAMYRCPFEP
jgi:hypothetical protein